MAIFKSKDIMVTSQNSRDYGFGLKQIKIKMKIDGKWEKTDRICVYHDGQEAYYILDIYRNNYLEGNKYIVTKSVSMTATELCAYIKNNRADIPDNFIDIIREQGELAAGIALGLKMSASW